MTLVTRTVTNYLDEIAAPNGALKANTEVVFHLVDLAKRNAAALFDASDGKYVAGTPVSVTTDVNGYFTVALWPNTRGEYATCYKVTLPGTTFKPVYIRVTEGAGSLPFLAARSNMESVSPQAVSLFDGLLASITQALGTATSLVTSTANGLMSFGDKVKLDAISGTNTGDQDLSGLVTKAGSLTQITTRQHSDLSGIGTNTHAQIDTALTRLANTSGTNTGDQDLSGLVTKAGSLTQITTRQHSDLSGIGTNTHAAIDTALTRLANTSGSNTGDQDLSGYALTSAVSTVQSNLDTYQTSNDAAVAAKLSKVVPSRSGYATAFGDSITNNVGASVASNGYANVFAASSGWVLDNRGANSTQLFDWFASIYGVKRYAGDNAFMLAGYNDMRFYGSDANGQAAFQAALYSAAAWLAIPDSEKITGRSGGVTYTGTWANTTVFGGATGRNTAVVGSTATFKVVGSKIVISTLQISTGGTFTVSVDGVSAGTFSCIGTVPASNSGITYSPKLIQLTGYSNGVHTVVITHASGGSVYFDWAAGIYESQLRPVVYVGNCLKMNSTGYALGSPTWNHGSDTVVGQFNTMISSVVSSLSALGLSVILVDASAAYNVATMVNPDNTHPADTGHAAIAAAFSAALIAAPAVPPATLENLPTAQQKLALVGTSGVPGRGNEYVTKAAWDAKFPSGTNAIDGTTVSTAPSAGPAAALPATPAGYVTVSINGINRQIPFY